LNLTLDADGGVGCAARRAQKSEQPNGKSAANRPILTFNLHDFLPSVA